MSFVVGLLLAALTTSRSNASSTRIAFAIASEIITSRIRTLAALAAKTFAADHLHADWIAAGWQCPRMRDSFLHSEPYENQYTIQYMHKSAYVHIPRNARMPIRMVREKERVSE